MKKQEEDFLHLMNKKCINLIECWMNYNHLKIEQELGSISVVINEFPQKVIPNKNTIDTYYEDYFPHPVDIHELCMEYVMGLLWVFNFYFLEKSNDWVYKFERSPLVKDLVNSIPIINVHDSYVEQNCVRYHFNGIEQLIYITPTPRVMMIIPEKYKAEFKRALIEYPELDMKENQFTFKKLDCRMMTFLNKCISTVVFNVDEKIIENICTDYPKNNFEFESNESGSII